MAGFEQSKELVKAMFEKMTKDHYDITSFDALTYDDGAGHPVNMWKKFGAETSNLIHISGDIANMKETVNKELER
jgi:hypothetical protein